MTDQGGSGGLKFHRDFGTSLEMLQQSRRFQTTITHSSRLFRSNAICTWIPKVVCSSLRYSIARANGMLGPAHSVHWIHRNNQAFRPQLRDCFNADYSFVVLRCPLERIVSAFFNKLVDDTQAGEFQKYFGKVLDRPQIDTFFSFGHTDVLEVRLRAVRTPFWQATTLGRCWSDAMKRVFLHVGKHKTGTTSIQKFLAFNRETLLRCGRHWAWAIVWELKRTM